MFEHYFCFINIEEMKEVLTYIESEDQDDELLDFSKYLQIFKLNYY